jgi:hypothetical protein
MRHVPIEFFNNILGHDVCALADDDGAIMALTVTQYN